MNKTPKQIIEEYNPKLPNRFVYFILQKIAGLLSLRNGAKFVYHFNKKEMRGKQVLLISDHSSRSEYIYTLGGYPFTRFNIVIGYHNAFMRLLPVLLKIGPVFKKNFQPEIKPFRQLDSIVSQGGSIMLFPEGLQSVTGTTRPVLRSTVKLFRKIGLPVVLCKSYGAFFRNPDYNPAKIKGHQEFHFEVLFTAEELKETDCDELYSKLMDRFRFNDSEWIKDKDYEYSCKQGLANNIESILYMCPECGREEVLESDGEVIRCSGCGYSVRLNPQYRFERLDSKEKAKFETIPEWYEAQREKVRHEIESEGFEIKCDCRRVRLVTEKIASDKYEECERGVLKLTNEGLFYTCSDNSDNESKMFNIRGISNFAKYKGVDIGMYYEGDFVGFSLTGNDSKKASKLILAESELLFRESKSWKYSFDAAENRTGC